MSAPAWGSPAAIYALDKRSAVLCTTMSINGFAFDAERASEMLSLLAADEAAAAARLADACGRPVNALSIKDLQRAFFSKRSEGGLGAHVVCRSELTGGPSLGVDAMRAYAACADDALRAASLAVLDVRRARKIRSTYIARPLSNLSALGRIHPSWMNYGAVSGRWSCQDPNLMNLPRAATEPASIRALGGIRSLYVAPPGRVLVSFDASQLEMRIAAYASGDTAMIGACESSDLHGGNARVIFGAAFDFDCYLAFKLRSKKGPPLSDAERTVWEALEDLRTLAKSAGFAVCYMAEAETVFARIVADGKGHLLPKGIRTVEAMLSKLRTGFATYFAWQETRRAGPGGAIATGYTDEPITGRRRWLGHDPKPTECANHPIQGGAAGLMNLKLPAICAQLARELPSVLPIAQVHDSGVFECDEAHAERVESVCKEEFDRPVELRSSGLSARFPIDIKKGKRWS